MKWIYTAMAGIFAVINIATLLCVLDVKDAWLIAFEIVLSAWWLLVFIFRIIHLYTDDLRGGK